MNEKKKSKKKGIIAVLLLVLLLLIIAGYFLIFHRKQDDGRLKAGFLPGIDEETLQTEADENYIRIQINSTPVFENGGSEGNLYIGNPETNNYEMYVVITLAESGEIIYDSGKIPPGFYIDEDKLLVQLEQGRHEAVAEITYYGEGDHVQSQTNIKLEVIVKN